jgi:catechol 2,3-dioxygenase-like lactoylglutathione lyase family enzyme
MIQLHHLALRSRDVPSLLRFYQQWFQLEVARDALPRSVWLSLGPGSVLMIEAAAVDEPGVPVGSQEFLAFRVSSERRTALRAELLAAGMLEAETAHTLYFRDPEGRRVGVSSYPLVEAAPSSEPTRTQS